LYGLSKGWLSMDDLGEHKAASPTSNQGAGGRVETHSARIFRK
jgi:hypothetical protein